MEAEDAASISIYIHKNLHESIVDMLTSSWYFFLIILRRRNFDCRTSKKIEFPSLFHAVQADVLADVPKEVERALAKLKKAESRLKAIRYTFRSAWVRYKDWRRLPGGPGFELDKSRCLGDRETHYYSYIQGRLS